MCIDTNMYICIIHIYIYIHTHCYTVLTSWMALNYFQPVLLLFSPDIALGEESPTQVGLEHQEGMLN